MNPISDTWHYIQNPTNDFGGHTHDFLQICILSILYAIIISVPLGVVAAQNKQLAFLASNISGLGRAIPTIAFFGLAAALPFIGVANARPAIIAMTVLGIPPILLNTVAALQGLDPTLVDAARGVGMTRLQSLTRVQLPLVLPVIAAGVRTSAVQIVATAPLASIVGAGGYGDYILGGIGLTNFIGYGELLAGLIPVLMLTLVAEFGLAGIQRALTPVALRKEQQVRNIMVNPPPDDGKGVVAA